MPALNDHGAYWNTSMWEFTAQVSHRTTARIMARRLSSTGRRRRLLRSRTRLVDGHHAGYANYVKWGEYQPILVQMNTNGSRPPRRLQLSSVMKEGDIFN